MTDLTSNEVLNILNDNYTGHLGFTVEGKPFVLPISYYYDKEEHAIISYSAEGHKIDAMRKNPLVSLFIAEVQSVYNWQSILVHGTFEELKGTDAKQQLHQFTEGIQSIIKNKEDRETEFINEFSSKGYSHGVPVVYRIKILKITGKRKET